MKTKIIIISVLFVLTLVVGIKYGNFLNKNNNSALTTIDKIKNDKGDKLNVKEDEEKQDDLEIKSYIVESGDTIYKIAQKFSVTENTILWENNLTSKSIIKPGMTLRILPVNGISYNVKKGDTLSKIASLYNISQDKIKQINKLNTDRLSVGEKLILPNAKKRYIAYNKKVRSNNISRKTSSIAKSSQIHWSRGALHELYKIPYFVRPTVKNKINNYAKSHGINYITREIFNSIHI